MFASFILTVCLVAWATVCSGEDVVVQMFSKNPINYISDKYVSYSVDPIELLEMNEEKDESFIYRMMESAPCYLKIYGNNTNYMRLNGDSIDLNSSKLSLDRLKNVYNVMRSAGIKPVIALPYDPKHWDTRNIMRILGRVSLLEMDDITWQLGADFHAKDAISYLDDLHTLNLIVGAFSQNGQRKNWSVVGSDITLGSSEDETRIYSELSKFTVDAVGWSQPIDLSYSDENMDDFFSNSNIEPALRTILNGDSPVWLSVQQKKTDMRNPLAHMKQGLNWAQTLGDAAKNGFKAVFTPMNKQNWYEHSMSYYTTLLHKRIIGQTVFDTKIFNGNRFDSHFYAHCTKNMSGSFAMFGVNGGESNLDINAKLPFRSGTKYMEFVLTVGVNGKVYLNGAEIVEPAVLTPDAKFKLPGKNAILSMPAHSIAFWVFTEASIPECSSTETISFENEQLPQRSSSEILLQQLIVNAVAREQSNDSDDEENAIKRTKRHTILKRDDLNAIDKHSEYNAIEMNGADLAMQTRDKRFIGDVDHANRMLYNTIDDLKRHSFVAPYKRIIPVKRMKRDINMLKNLFDKFDIKKPTFNFKTPSLKLGSKGLIPPISTVHDVFNPGTNEKRIFENIENPELPNGDVYFELAAPEYPATVNTANQAPNQLGDGFTPLNVVPNVIPNAPLDIYAHLAQPQLPPQPSTQQTAPIAAVNPPSSNGLPSFGELSEMDLRPEVVTPPPQTPNQIPAPGHQLQFVVKDLPPTWQVNLANMERARNNLRQNLWPMSANTQAANRQTVVPQNGNAEIANSKIASYLPNVAHVHNIPAQEHVLFESKRRRRRAIDSKMNEEIENRVQKGSIIHDVRLTDTTEQVEMLDKILKMIEEMERSQNTVLKSSGGIRKMLLNKKLNENEMESDSPKKCKILSMAMEKRCLQSETQPKNIFKRAIETNRKNAPGPLKKFIARMRDSVDRPLKFRTKRSIYHWSEPIKSSENEINAIAKELNDDIDDNVPRKIVYVKRRYEPKTTTAKPPHSTTITPLATTTQKTEPKTEAKSKKPLPTVMKAVKGAFNNVTDAVARQIGRFWLALS